MPPPQGSFNPLEGPGDYTTTKEVHSDTYPAIDPNNADLSGKAVFITGASRGVGKAIALSFARAGASSIAIAARSDLSAVEKELKQAAVRAGRPEPHVLCLELNLGDAASANAAAEKISNTFGKLDVLVNNAGVFGTGQLIGEDKVDEWWQVFNVNLFGTYTLSRACIPLLLKSETKTLVTIASVGAFIIGPGFSAYQTSKLAVLRLTDFIAAEYADQGISAYNLHPGNIATDMTSGVDDSIKHVFCDTPELTADSIVFLMKEKREWLSGRYVNCTWDLPELTSDKMKAKIIEKDALKVTLSLP